MEEKRRWVKVSLRRETYERLRAFAESHGLTSLNDAIELLLTTVSSKETSDHATVSSKCDELLTTLSSKIDDFLTTLSSKVDSFLTTVGSKVDKHLATLSSKSEGHLATVSSKVSRRRTMLDILRDVKVQLLSEVGPRDPDRFVARARSLGAVVIEGGKDVALVDPDFWAFFKENLHNLPKRIEDVRDVALRKLVTFMREEGLIYYDAIKKRWLFVDNTVAIG